MSIEIGIGAVAPTRSGQPQHNALVEAQLDRRMVRARYVDPEPVPNSLEVREVSEQRGYGHALGGKTKA